MTHVYMSWFVTIIQTFVLFLYGFSITTSAADKPHSLLVSEGFSNPLGFHDSKPTFSWKLPDGVKRQNAYQLVVTDVSTGKMLWNSGKVVSDQSVWIPFGGKPLESRQRLSWKVKFWGDDNIESAWSAKSLIEMGLMSNEDWSAQWIEAPTGGKISKAHPGYYFRKDFNTPKKIARARLYATALGIFEFHINGQRVGEDILSPGWTSYENRVETLTYDVTSLIRKGDNAIGALLGEGWYAGSLVTRDISKLKGRKPKLLAQLELTYADGSTERIKTDGTWKVTANGPIERAGLYYGVDYDARKELGKWTEPSYDADSWQIPVTGKISEKPLLEPKRLPPVRVMQTLKATTVKQLKPGVFIIDFGQNLVGFPELRIPVIKDAKIKIRVAEMLNKDGTLYTENYRDARSSARYTTNVDGQVIWAPQLTFFGFRYLELSGFPADVKLNTDAAVAKVIHTAFSSSGKFTSSNTKLNQLQSNIRWGQIGNFVDIPTDCPQRNERLGWTGDAQVILESSFFNYNLYAFWARWLQTVRDDQAPNGEVPHVAPSLLGGGSPGWADVIVTAPWQIYVRTGDIRILEDNYRAMKKWMAVYEREAKNFITDRKGFGDWLQPYAKHGNKGETPMNLIATAYFGRDAQIMIQTAAALGIKNDAARYRKLHADIRTAFSKKFFDAKGKLTVTDTQTGYLMALAYDLLEPELRKNAEAHLVAAFERADRHLRTGFLGTPLIAPTFDTIGRPEIAYELLLKESYPSWFYSINQGATTMWERWNSYSHKDGFGNAAMNSFNHYAYGAIGQWMYERVAGLAPDPARPGYKHILIQPLVNGPLKSASAEYESPYGLAKSAWKKSQGQLTMDVIIPPNTTASVTFPITNENTIRVNGKPLKDSELVKTKKLNQHSQITVELTAGTYQFKLSPL